MKTLTLKLASLSSSMVAGLFLLPSTTLATPQVIFFGDSLTDTGSFLTINQSVGAVAGGNFPTFPVTAPGRFSNGSVWSDYLSGQLGLNPIPGFALNQATGVIPADGANFALGGATTTTDNVGIPGFPGIADQFGLFSALLANGNNANTLNPDALYVLWGGANDYLGRLYNPAPFPVRTPTEVVGNISNYLVSLAQSGAKRILVANLPDLGTTPFGLSQSTAIRNELNDLSQEHNLLLSQSLVSLRQTYSNTEFIDWNVNAVFDDFFVNPTRYGFTNPAVACTGTDLFTGTIDPDPNNFTVCNNGDSPSQLAFWDTQHPTTKAHQFIAQSAAQALGIPEPSAVSGIAVLGLGLLGGLIRRSFASKP